MVVGQRAVCPLAAQALVAVLVDQILPLLLSEAAAKFPFLPFGLVLPLDLPHLGWVISGPLLRLVLDPLTVTFVVSLSPRTYLVRIIFSVLNFSSLGSGFIVIPEAQALRVQIGSTLLALWSIVRTTISLVHVLAELLDTLGVFADTTSASCHCFLLPFVPVLHRHHRVHVVRGRRCRLELRSPACVSCTAHLRQQSSHRQ